MPLMMPVSMLQWVVPVQTDGANIPLPFPHSVNRDGTGRDGFVHQHHHFDVWRTRLAVVACNPPLTCLSARAASPLVNYGQLKCA